MITLRPYQEDVKNAVYDHLRTRQDNPCAVVPTAGGKTPIMASICKDAVGLWGGRVLILAHVKELLEQTAEKLGMVCPEVGFGIYSAGLKRRDTDHPVIIASIQSVYKRACELDRFDLILIDEAHLISPDSESMYQHFLADARIINPEVRIVGFTATPYRLKSGSICTVEGILNHICYEVGVRELIRDGFLCPLISKAGRSKVDTSELHIRGGEFITDEVEALMDQDSLVQSAVSEIIQYTTDRHACLIFASSIQHGKHIVDVLADEHSVECGFVCGETPTLERDLTLARFKTGKLKYLCNVNVLTTGFDSPRIDCVALVRPTMSPGLFYQQVGRGFRLHPGKENCLVLDFGGNVLRHGPVDDIRVTTNDRGDGKAPAKECPECRALIATGFATCPQCGYVFPPPDRRQHDPKASEAGILSGQVTTTKYQVEDAYYGMHSKRGADEGAPRTLRVDYRIGWHDYKSEWVCFEHEGYARQKAIAWWRKRSDDPVPDTVDRALEIIEGGGLAPTIEITVRSVAGEQFERIIDYKLGPIPDAIGISDRSEVDLQDAPF
ncbi:MAG: DNA helicase [Planctomycetota bacterium]|nr:MAG: DNA helicase [Planctomycetota bacterium]